MNCKIGDLAIIINSVHPENLGAIVKVIASGEPEPDIVLPYWHCRTASGRTLKFTYHRSGDTGYAAGAFMYDWQLRPLRTDEIPKTISTPVPIEAVSV